MIPELYSSSLVATLKGTTQGFSTSGLSHCNSFLLINLPLPNLSPNLHFTVPVSSKLPPITLTKVPPDTGPIFGEI